MICYKDRTFCIAQCLAKDCPDMLTQEIRTAAEAWWKSPNAPIAISDFSINCKDYTPKQKDSNANS